MLNHAIRQVRGEGHDIREKDFRSKLIEHLGKVDFKNVRADVDRFIINREELKFLDFESVKSLLRNY